jgi:hypothetical protein
LECRLAGETEVLGENLPQRHFVHHKIPHDQTQVWTRAAAVGSRRLTAWAMVWRTSVSFLPLPSISFAIHQPYRSTTYSLHTHRKGKAISVTGGGGP